MSSDTKIFFGPVSDLVLYPQPVEKGEVVLRVEKAPKDFSDRVERKQIVDEYWEWKQQSSDVDGSTDTIIRDDDNVYHFISLSSITWFNVDKLRWSGNSQVCRAIPKYEYSRFRCQDEGLPHNHGKLLSVGANYPRGHPLHGWRAHHDDWTPGPSRTMTPDTASIVTEPWSTITNWQRRTEASFDQEAKQTVRDLIEVVEMCSSKLPPSSVGRDSIERLIQRAERIFGIGQEPVEPEDMGERSVYEKSSADTAVFIDD